MKKYQNVAVVIPCAGSGTRLYPHSKATPKELTPLDGKPILQIIIEQILFAGIPKENIAIVYNSKKQAINDYFSRDYIQEIKELEAKGKAEIADRLRQIPQVKKYILQRGHYGNETPLYCALDFIGNRDVLYVFPDDLFFMTKSEIAKFGNEIQQILQAREMFKGSILSCKMVEDDSEYDKYGIVSGILLPGNEAVRAVSEIHEKPGLAAAKSNQASVSAFYFENAVLKYIAEDYRKTPFEGEKMIQSAIQDAICDGLEFYSLTIRGGVYCDAGNELGLKKTAFLFDLHSSYGAEFCHFAKEELAKRAP